MKIANRKSQIGNQKKHTPIPGLAEHIAAFTNKREIKAELAAIRAAFADKVYAASVTRKGTAQ